MATAFIGIGSNIGDRCAWIRAGIGALQAGGARIVATSSLYLTEPVGDDELAWFVNAVVAIEPRLEPDDLVRECLRIELECGRARSTADADGAPPSSRTLDLDLLLYDQRVLDLPGLRLPHPRMHERRFVLQPFREIAPRIRHPVLGKTIAELDDAVPRAERVWLLAPPPGSTDADPR